MALFINRFDLGKHIIDVVTKTIGSKNPRHKSPFLSTIFSVLMAQTNICVADEHFTALSRPLTVFNCVLVPKTAAAVEGEFIPSNTDGHGVLSSQPLSGHHTSHNEPSLDAYMLSSIIYDLQLLKDGQERLETCQQRMETRMECIEIVFVSSSTFYKPMQGDLLPRFCWLAG